MARNWKRAHDKLKADHDALQRKTFDLGFSLEQEKQRHRTALNDLTLSNNMLGRAVTAIDSAVEIFTAHDRSGTAATFRMIANDLRPRDGARSMTANEERR